jgi:hypothetical protein
MPAEPISLGFSIADAEDVDLSYDGDVLQLRFTDWHGRRLALTFEDAVAFRWQRAEDVQPGEVYDGSNIDRDSAWLAGHRRQQEAAGDHRHLILNFNAAGRLEVLCTRVSHEVRD